MIGNCPSCNCYVPQIHYTRICIFRLSSISDILKSLDPDKNLLVCPGGTSQVFPGLECDLMLLLASHKIRRSGLPPKDRPKENQLNIALEHSILIISIFVVTGSFDGFFKENKKTFSDQQYPQEYFHGLSENQPNMKPPVPQITIMIGTLQQYWYYLRSLKTSLILSLTSFRTPWALLRSYIRLFTTSFEAEDSMATFSMVKIE